MDQLVYRCMDVENDYMWVSLVGSKGVALEMQTGDSCEYIELNKADAKALGARLIELSEELD